MPPYFSFLVGCTKQERGVDLTDVYSVAVYTRKRHNWAIMLIIQLKLLICLFNKITFNGYFRSMRFQEKRFQEVKLLLCKRL